MKSRRILLVFGSVVLGLSLVSGNALAETGYVLTDLGPLANAYGINNSSQIVGNSHEGILYDMAYDKTQPMCRRVNALFLLHEGDYELIEDAREKLLGDDRVSDVAKELLEDQEPDT